MDSLYLVPTKRKTKDDSERGCEEENNEESDELEPIGDIYAMFC